MELMQGHCVRKIAGEPGTEAYYERLSEYPRELAKLWRVENAKSLHITDRDALYGEDNEDNQTMIQEIIDSIDIPIELFSRFDSVETCREWLELGVFRIILSTLILDDPEGVAQLVREYTSSRIVVAVRANNGVVEFGGEYPPIGDAEFALQAKELGIRRIIYSDLAWEGTYFGPDVDTLQRIASETTMRVTASGGIDSPQELWHVQDLVSFGVDSVVVGRAMFENRFPCQKIWRLIEAENNSEEDTL